MSNHGADHNQIEQRIDGMGLKQGPKMNIFCEERHHQQPSAAVHHLSRIQCDRRDLLEARHDVLGVERSAGVEDFTNQDGDRRQYPVGTDKDRNSRKQEQNNTRESNQTSCHSGNSCSLTKDGRLKQ
ncbi:hypothetical protein D3C85_1309010 [compost metagenome]